MKKLVFSLILISCISYSALSQMVIKPAIGMNFTSLTDDPINYSSSGRFGWQLGGTLTFGDKFYFEPGIFWMKNNWELQELNQATETTFTNDISSLRIPAFVGINILGDKKATNLHIFGGPTGMIVTKVNTGSTGLTKSDFAPVIYGIDAGAGVSFKKFFIDAGYEWGLTQIYKDDPNQAKNRGLWINFGFNLTFL
jgi:hypothetical protein